MKNKKKKKEELQFYSFLPDTGKVKFGRTAPYGTGPFKFIQQVKISTPRRPARDFPPRRQGSSETPFSPSVLRKADWSWEGGRKKERERG